MLQLESFEMDDVRFILDVRAGKHRGKSKDGEFVLVKTNAFLQFYRGLQQRQPKNILEIGMFEGGSLVLFDKLYDPKKLVGVDIRREPIEPLERYSKDREHIRPLYGLSQDDPRLPDILEEEFPEGIDLIVDDASHQYELSRATFHLCFPHLNPGGLYVIEDWSWSHKLPHQAPTHPWFEKPALTNLIMELVINMPDSRQMNRVTVRRDLVVVEKAGIATGAIDLDDGHKRLRGRELGLDVPPSAPRSPRGSLDRLALSSTLASLARSSSRFMSPSVDGSRWSRLHHLARTMRYAQPRSEILRRVAEAVLRAGGKRSPRNLVSPIELIAANNIGIHDKENVLDEYKRIGIAVTAKLKNRAGLRPESDVLDVGCGTGRVAIPLTEYLTTGSYTGVDVVESSIEWCRDAFRDFPNFNFIHADLYSEFYNPNASLTAEEYRFPFDRESFDVIWSSSLFTHMLMPAVDNYLKEMARVAKPDGIIWNSYLLLDEVSEPLVLGPRNDGRRMQYEVEGGRIAYKEKPEHVVGLYKDQVLALHEKHGLEIIEVQLSNWSGGRPDTEYRGQDVIIARKK